MANIIAELTARIEDYRKDNKNPCKNYKTEAAAEKATAKVAQMAANHFAIDSSKDAKAARYVVFYIEAWGRWVGAVDLTEVLARSTSTGGYIGCVSQAGFYSY